MIETKKGEKKGRFGNIHHDHPLFTGGLLGGLIGFFIVSPIALIVEHMTHTGTDKLGEHLRELFLFQSISWSALFTMLLVCIGFVFGYMQMRINRLESSLFQAEKMASVGQLAAGVAHEINTPISNISLIIEKILMNISDADTKLKEDLVDIAKQISNASKIVSDLLDFSRISDNVYEHININELMAHTITFIKNKRNENIDIMERYDDNIPLIKGDPVQLQQVFLNIINNAYDSMPNGGELTISSRMKNNEVIEISFKDTGNGIPKENLGKIFDPFFTTKSPGEGTGLGLSICHGIIERYKGKIDVDSKVNIGSTFTITIPR